MKIVKVRTPRDSHCASKWVEDDNGSIIGTAITGLYYCSKMVLAHELGHAIELITTGETSEHGAWGLAHQFINPSMWDECEYKALLAERGENEKGM